jgi:hypothetical protein
MLHYTAPNAIERGAGILVLLSKCTTYYHTLLANHHYLPGYEQLMDVKKIQEFLLSHYTTAKVNKLSAIATEVFLTLDLNVGQNVPLASLAAHKMPFNCVACFQTLYFCHTVQ